jgi:hypothetical protein
MKKLEDLKKELENNKIELKSYDFRKKRNKMDLKYWKELFINKFRRDKAVVVNMELKTGNHKTFYVTEKLGGFEFKKGVYIFDGLSMYWNSDFKNFCYDYHEDYCMPVKREIPVKEISNVMESAKLSDLVYSSNPHVLKKFIMSNVAEQILSGTKLSEFMRRLMVIAVVVLIATVIHLVLFMQKSGMLESLGVNF